MRIRLRKKTLFNIVLIVFVLSFFVTPLGYWGKILLNRIFAATPEVISPSQRRQLATYDWKLRNEDWEIFNFQRSEGKVVFINFWASWRLPSAAELIDIQKLYEKYKGRVDFYIITDEQRPPVVEFMEEFDFDFPVTHLIMEEAAPVQTREPPLTYILDKNGYITLKQQGIGDWDHGAVFAHIDSLIAAP